MKFQGTVEIAAPRDKVWAFVADPEQVASCGPGVESVTRIDDTHYKAIAKAVSYTHLTLPTTERV